MNIKTLCDCEWCACKDCGVALEVCVDTRDMRTRRCEECHETFVLRRKIQMLELKPLGRAQ